MISTRSLATKCFPADCGHLRETIVKAMLVVRVRLPEDPVTVIEAVPVVALGLTLRVRTLVVAEGLVPNEAVTPFGIPDALSFTLPVNPPASVTEIVLVPLPFWAIDRDAGKAESVKVGVTVSNTDAEVVA